MPYTPPRINRLFAADGCCFDVAVDHGMFNEESFLAGITDMDRALATLIAAAPDAIQLGPGMARRLQERPGPKPALVLRTDVANVYGPGRGRPHAFSTLIDDAVEVAVRLDAACVVVNILSIPGEAALHGQCLANVTRLRAACDRAGMPLMVEPLAMKDGVGDGYGVDGNPQRIIPLVRQAAELGADVIKADPTENLEDYHRVIEVAGGVPVLVRGGGRVPDAEVCRRTYAVMQKGARGIVYGRNVIQHRHPAGMTRALMAIVHERLAPDEALKLVAEH